MVEMEGMGEWGNGGMEEMVETEEMEVIQVEEVLKDNIISIKIIK
jgi:hypothetical protein